MSSEYSNEIDNKQKIAIGALVLLSILFIIAWFSQMKGNINGNIKRGVISENCVNGDCSLTTGEENIDERFKDTDNDGLSDYDEQSVYKTSPYLEDSDSDGVSDQEEIIKGTDPNCSLSEGCSNNLIIEREKAETENIEQILDIVDIDSSLESSLSGDLNEEAVMEDLLEGKKDASSLREFLVQSGIEKEMVDQISDEILMESYYEMIKE